MNRPLTLRPAHRIFAAVMLACTALTGCMPAYRQAPALAGITTPQDWSCLLYTSRCV